jgi:hypothetical protein
MSLSKTEKVARVDDILKQLGLEECQNTLIGDDMLGR